MTDEIKALKNQGTYELVSREPSMRILRTKWVGKKNSKQMVQ